MKFFILTVIAVFLLCCNNSKREIEQKKDTKVLLRNDTINVVKLSDTMVIYESTCRGCAYEESTRFSISDSLGIVKLEDVITTDNSSPDVAGGNVSKDLILVPLKAGLTTIKVYKFPEQTATAKDSARFTPYKIEIQN